MSDPQVALVTTFLEPELLTELRSRHPDTIFEYPEDLIPLPRYVGEHRAADPSDDASLRRWRGLLERADIMFDFGPKQFHSQLAGLPRLRWIQATSAGVGQFVRRVGLPSSQGVVVTTARGVHGRALAEFAVMATVYFNRDLPGILADQRDHRWTRRCGRLIAGQEVGIIGLGSVGQEVALAMRAFGARTTGVARSLAGRSAEVLGVDRLIDLGEIDQALPTWDVLVLAVPHTDETEGMLSAHRISLFKPGALLVNLARGSVVDEAALTVALRSGRLAAAALDVFREEPLPAASPLWDLPNLLVTPHSMSTVEGENQLLAQLFSDNLARFNQGRPLLNTFDPERLY
ncbi:MAG: D-2-hydroxyacid dehydrogenase [Candidatus Dormiibacterota bacterium]